MNTRKMLVLLLVLILGLTGCTSTDPKEVTGTVKVVDSTGEEIEVSVNPKKVAIFIPQALDIIDAAGFENTGIETLGVQKSNLPKYLEGYLDEKYLNVGTLFEADLDILDLMQPDLIIYGGRFGAEGRVAEGKSLSEVKARYKDVEFVNLEFGDTNFEENIKQNFEILGKIFPGIQSNLEEGIKEISSGFNEINELAKNHSAMFLMPNAGNLQFYGKNSRFGYVHSTFGFKPAVDTDEEQANHGNSVSVEFILENNPEIIILLDRESATSGSSSAIKDFNSNEIIKQTSAYKNKHIYEIDPVAWYILPGGFTSSKQMISDLKEIVNNLK